MENITELVRRQRSVRTFAGKEVSADDRKKLALFMEKIDLGIAPYHLYHNYLF